MKLLCGGSDLVKLERVRRKLTGMGIACELVNQFEVEDDSEIPSYPELWVRQLEDYPTAEIVLTQAGVVGKAWRL